MYFKERNTPDPYASTSTSTATTRPRSRKRKSQETLYEEYLNQAKKTLAVKERVLLLKEKKLEMEILQLERSAILPLSKYGLCYVLSDCCSIVSL